MTKKFNTVADLFQVIEDSGIDKNSEVYVNGSGEMNSIQVWQGCADGRDHLVIMCVPEGM